MVAAVNHKHYGHPCSQEKKNCRKLDMLVLPTAGLKVKKLEGFYTNFVLFDYAPNLYLLITQRV